MNEDFAAGAIAVSNEELIIDFIAAGNMESVVFTWYRIYDPNSEQCVIALYGDDGVTSIEKCDAEDNGDLTRALLKTLNFGANTEDFESEAWLCVLDDGHVNSQFVDKSILRKTLEAGAAQLEVSPESLKLVGGWLDSCTSMRALKPKPTNHHDSRKIERGLHARRRA